MTGLICQVSHKTVGNCQVLTDVLLHLSGFNALPANVLRRKLTDDRRFAVLGYGVCLRFYGFTVLRLWGFTVMGLYGYEVIRL